MNPEHPRPEHPNSEHPDPEQANPERPSRRRTIMLGVGLAAALLVAAGASVLLGAWAGTPVAAASPRASASPTALPSPTPRPTATPQPTPTPNPFDQAMLRGRYTVLVIGDDANDKRDLRGHASRTDSLMVVSISPRQRHVSMISIPRDTVDVPMANGLTYTGKVNGIAYAHGYDALLGAIETMLAIDIDGYVKVDMDNFVQLVDAVGGVRVTNKYWINDAHLDLVLGPGKVHLDGATALDYVRSRYTDSDYARAARQQQVLIALARKYLNSKADWDLDDLLLMLDSFQTDIDLADLPTLKEMGRRARKADVTTIVLSPPRFSLFAGIEPNSVRGWIIIPNLAEMRAYAQSVMGD